MTQTRSAQTQALVAGHFAQGTHYYSESKGAMIPIEEMAPKHAANAAERLMREAEHWCMEAGATAPHRAFTWAAGTPLVRALWARSQATSTTVKPETGVLATGFLPDAYWCADCTFATNNVVRMAGHQSYMGHVAR